MAEGDSHKCDLPDTRSSLVLFGTFCCTERVAREAPVTQEQLQQWKLLADFRARLAPLAQESCLHPSWENHNRKLEQRDYLCLFLFGLVNPVLKTMRALCAATPLARVRAQVSSRPVSKSAFSEAQHLLDPRLLEQLIESLAQECAGPLPKDPHAPWPLWLARDSSIFPALSRMVWARYGCGKPGRLNNAVRLHVSFHLWDDKPVQVALTPGCVCERQVWRTQLVAGATYVGDRYFAQDYKMFALLEEKGCRFVLRLGDDAVVNDAQEIPLSSQATAAGILSDQWVTLGVRRRTGRLRVLTVRKPSGTLLRLVTNIPPEEMSARDLQVLYRRRWQIESFFRWLKCLMGVRHFLAESPTGVATQLYLAIIAGLMLQSVLGRRPDQRLWERVQLYLMGWATLDELMSAVEAARALAVKKS